MPKLCFGQVTTDTISLLSKKDYVDSSGVILERVVMNYEIRTTLIAKPNFAIPTDLLSDKRMKEKALKIMSNAAKKEDTVFKFVSILHNPFYKFWKGEGVVGDEYKWKGGCWNIQTNKIVSISGSFEEKFWWKLIGCIILALITGRLSFMSVIDHGESLYAHIVIQFLVMFAITLVFFFGLHWKAFNYIHHMYFIKIVTIACIVCFFGGRALYKAYPRQIIK
jgi:hypothetical protein